jgi:ectoine hydroxylase-related dioxygenase (phytanoyl-CoA dioxygenase family)
MEGLEVESFWRDGVTCVRGVLDPAWVDRLASVVERHAPGPSGNRSNGFWNRSHLWRANDPDVTDLLSSTPICAIVAEVLRTTGLWLYEDTLIVKEPGSKRSTPWHQDLPYYPLAGHQIGTIWISLDRVGQASGAVRYVAGSHRWGRRFEPSEFGSDRRYEGPGLEAIPDPGSFRGDDLVTFETDPGDCIIHHALTLHGAPGNLTLGRRRALAISMFGDDTRYAPTVFPWDHDQGDRLRSGELAVQDAFPRILP